MNRIVLRNEVPEGAGDSGVDAWGRLSEVEVPVVVVCGDLDVPFLVERSRVLAERLPNARYHEIAGMAHMPYLEDPAVLVDLLQEALGG
jgi:pimeloyl-ACP methyl ester carboxylesterase